VWGTIGWIAASWPFIFILVNWATVPSVGEAGLAGWFEAMFKPENSLKDEALRGGQRYIFLVSGVASLILAAYSLVLPHTPPRPAAGKDSLAWLKAMRLLRHPFVLVLFVVTFIDAAVHQSFFYWTPTFLSKDVGISPAWVTPVMKIGQVAEILIMALLGLMLTRLGFRTVITLGALAYFIRYLVWSVPAIPVPVQVASQALHGICYACFFAGAFIYTDRVAPPDARHSVQTVFGIIILGGGPVLGGILSGWLAARYGLPSGGVDFAAVWRVTALIGLAAGLFFFAFFRERPAAVGGTPV
jgi:predicted MFS family arabinose efflux permease